MFYNANKYSRQQIYPPCAHRPVPPAYRLIGTASLWALTFSKYAIARWTFIPFMAWATSRVFLKDTRRKAPRALAVLVGLAGVAEYRTWCGYTQSALSLFSIYATSTSSSTPPTRHNHFSILTSSQTAVYTRSPCLPLCLNLVWGLFRSVCFLRNLSNWKPLPMCVDLKGLP